MNVPFGKNRKHTLIYDMASRNTVADISYTFSPEKEDLLQLV